MVQQKRKRKFFYLRFCVHARPNGDKNVNVNAMHFRQRPKTTRSQQKRDAFLLAPGALTKLVPQASPAVHLGTSLRARSHIT